MAYITNDLEYLKSRGSVKAKTGSIMVVPQYCKREILDVSDLVPKFNGCYAVKNSTVAFVFNNEVFVTPETRKVREVLNRAAFRMSCFPVPFSDYEYPYEEKAKWEMLKERAREARAEELAEDCALYCNEAGVGKLSEQTLKNCFEIPESGVWVDFPSYPTCYFPIITTATLNMMTVQKIGKYCKNNGKVVFVYQNGKTYVAKGYKIVDELEAAGYKEDSMCVPFSRGEVIREPALKARWEALAKF